LESQRRRRAKEAEGDNFQGDLAKIYEIRGPLLSYCQALRAATPATSQCSLEAVIEAVECGPLVKLLNFDLGGISYVDQIWNLTREKQELKPTLREVFAKLRYLQTLSPPGHPMQMTTTMNSDGRDAVQQRGRMAMRIRR
jgi:hypothetical protein